MSSRKDNLGVADLVQCIALLFPTQHPKCAAWAATRSPALSHPVAASKPDVKPPFPPAVAKKPGQQQRQVDSHLPRSARRSSRQFPPTHPPAPSRPPVVPPVFARELTESLEDWRDRHQGNQISFAQEVVQRDKFAAAAGLSTWSPGYAATMLTVIGSVSIGAEPSVSIEIVIPRLQQLQTVLVGAGPKGMPKRYFETVAIELSPERVRQIGSFVLESGGR